jgi:hypothetical protein
MASDDEDELAALRRQRNARLGLPDVSDDLHWRFAGKRCFEMQNAGEVGL